MFTVGFRKIAAQPLAQSPQQRAATLTQPTKLVAPPTPAPPAIGKLAAIYDELLDDQRPVQPSADMEKPKGKKNPKTGGPSCPVTSVMGSSFPR
jgi:hypothetical protein